MPPSDPLIALQSFQTFGDLLKYLRARARLTQRELSIAVGYSESHISRLEQNQRPPDLAALMALFVPALGLEEEPDTLARLLELASVARGEQLPSSGNITIIHSIGKEVTETFEAIEIPNNLPLQMTSFIGRETEIEEIKHLLQAKESIRLLTLVGVGGCGKTRLALQAAGQVVHLYPHGVWFIDLAPLADPNLVSKTTAAVLGLFEAPEQDITGNLTNFLRDKKILILFDNCEHVLHTVAELSESLLRSAKQLQVLATSREILNIPGEKQFHVLPLPYPPEGSDQKKTVAEFDSVRLFIQRAQYIHPSFELTDENASYTAQVCRRLDGIPLAIELAAARVNLLRVQQITKQLDDRFRLLTSGARTLPRHQTLRAMIDWSHDLLSDEERRLFRRLSVFAGGWTLEAADAVVNETPNTPTLELLSHLVDKSFIVAERDPGMEARYTMLETIREYARGRLQEAGEVSKLQKRHFDYFLDFAGKARVFGPQKSMWLNRLEAEQDNFRVALAWALESEPPEQVDKGTFLVGLLADYFFYRGYVTEALEWFAKFLPFDLPPTRGRALGFQKAGFLTRVRGDFDRAVHLLKRSLAISRAIGDNERVGWALLDFGHTARDMGNTEEVIPCYSEALSLFQELQDRRGILNSYYLLADSYMQMREMNQAKSLWEQGLEISREMNDKSFVAWGLEGLASTAFVERRTEQAKMLHRESLKYKVEVMDKAGMAYSFEGLAQVASLEEEPELAAILWGAAQGLRILLNMPLDPSRQDFYVSLIPNTREQIGDQAFDRAWKKGKAMTLNQAIEFALTRPDH